jgi:4-hydroxymandelate oxidase
VSLPLSSLDDYEREARSRLSADLTRYIYSGAESESTLRRNVEAFSLFKLRRRVLHGIQNVETRMTYFNGAFSSELPFFPSCINVSPMYEGALLDILKACKSFGLPFLVSDLGIPPSLDVSKIPELVDHGCPVVWQIYMDTTNLERCIKYSGLAKEWGYSALIITVDTELNIKLGNEVPKELMQQSFLAVTPREVTEIRNQTSLPLIVKGIMTPEDAEIAIESGANGVVVSNHGGRTLDEGQSSIEVLSDVVQRLTSKKATRGSEVFLDGGIRRGTSILKAMALGARACLIGRPVFWGLAVNKEKGVMDVLRILKSELVRAAALSGVADLSRINENILAKG